MRREDREMERLVERVREAERRELVEAFTGRTNAVRAAERVGVDAVIEPGETRDRRRLVAKETPGQPGLIPILRALTAVTSRVGDEGRRDRVLRHRR